MITVEETLKQLKIGNELNAATEFAMELINKSESVQETLKITKTLDEFYESRKSTRLNSSN